MFLCYAPCFLQGLATLIKGEGVFTPCRLESVMALTNDLFDFTLKTVIFECRSLPIFYVSIFILAGV